MDENFAYWSASFQRAGKWFSSSLALGTNVVADIADMVLPDMPCYLDRARCHCSKKRKKNNKIYNLVKALEGMLFHENDNEKMIEILNEALKKTKTKRQNLGLKHLLAAYKEKAGKIEEAIELYKEVAENGNKLYIVQEAREKLKKLI